MNARPTSLDDVLAYYPENPRGIGCPISDHFGAVIGRCHLLGLEEAPGRGLMLRMSDSARGCGSLAFYLVPAPLRALPGATYAEKCAAARGEV